MTSKKLSGSIPLNLAGERLDRALAALFPDFSRSRLQQWLRDGHVRVGQAHRRSSDKVLGGEFVEIHVPEVEESPWQPQSIPLVIVYEDDAVLVIAKPAGLVVHPGAGNRDGTLLNALLHHVPQLEAMPRAGIVHRLDKDTSGLIVVAKTEPTRLQLMKQLRTRALKREYLAIVNGVMIAGGEVDAPIGRHPKHRTRMAVHPRGKPALSRYRVKRKYRAHSLVHINLTSGRTHQIRVHMAHIGFPIVGDPAYGGRMLIPSSAEEPLTQALRGFRRQALHASKLGVTHPVARKKMEWISPMPGDMQALIDVLEKDALSRKGRGS
ncbi:MAG: 23S rRNA pseudouridine(1911/1915/1917) synthase RluD [Acidiferrobacterales bacterium]